MQGSSRGLVAYLPLGALYVRCTMERRYISSSVEEGSRCEVLRSAAGILLDTGDGDRVVFVLVTVMEMRMVFVFEKVHGDRALSTLIVVRG